MNIQDCCVGLKGVISSIHKVTRALSGTTNSITISSAIDEVATAIENGGGGGVFVAEYDVTSYIDIETAMELNKAVLVKWDGALVVPLECYKLGSNIILRRGLSSDGNEMMESSFTISPQSVWSFKSRTSELQFLLVSGTNIKTINNKSILGSGNVDTTVLESPNGTQYKLKVANDGTLSTEVI